MNTFYQQLTNGSGSREVIAAGTTVTTDVKKSVTSTNVKTTYTFKGATNISKETRNLVLRTTNLVSLTKIEIVRQMNVKNVSINVRFLNDDDVLIHSETDVNLLLLSDHVLLSRLGIQIV